MPAEDLNHYATFTAPQHFRTTLRNISTSATGSQDGDVLRQQLNDMRFEVENYVDQSSEVLNELREQAESVLEGTRYSPNAQTPLLEQMFRSLSLMDREGDPKLRELVAAQLTKLNCRQRDDFHAIQADYEQGMLDMYRQPPRKPPFNQYLHEARFKKAIHNGM